MTEEPKKGQWRECEIAGVRHLVWVPPPGSLEEGQPFPFWAVPADKSEAAIEDDLWSFWRKDYEAARQFAYQAHELLKICRKYEDMLALCGATTPESEEGAICVLRHLCANMDSLADLKIKKLPHRDAVFMSQPKP